MSSSWRDLNSLKIATTIQLLKINLKIERKKKCNYLVTVNNVALFPVTAC